ncbi:hypothetical protein N7530_004978 [Penicillium desertorum]|uniref:Uncharacterized protein n=1 Tax=Penicillium desertorum TaxID=1303715 RepID=A0A9W9WZ46_9EURO|nr:hypothetical protein N7530_004978 [Penicillium desertorum]
MQQATCWFNIAKWEEEKKEKAAKASQIETEVQELRDQVGDLTDKLDTTERAHSKLIPISTDYAHHNGSREFVVAVPDAKNVDGSKKYPLDVRMNTHVTKVTFDETENPPRAPGVEFLEREHIYKASPMSRSALPDTPGSATASCEVILSGGLEEMDGELERLSQDLSDVQTGEGIDVVEEQKIWSQVEPRHYRPIAEKRKM